MKGRKPTPTALKVLRGNPGRRPINRNEPTPDAGIPDCPAHLDEEARKEWFRVADELNKVGLITTLDRTALAAYCSDYSQWIAAADRVRKSGMLINSPNGYPMMNPALAIENKAKLRCMKFLSEFGMTPASRSRIHLNPNGPSNPNKTQASQKSSLAEVFALAEG